MTEKALLQVLNTLDKMGLNYMLTGSYASNVYGKVRSTFDADVVIALQSAQMRKLIQSLEKDFYFDSKTIAEAEEANGQFNAIHSSSGFKIDFYLLRREAYEQTALKRKRQHLLWGQNVWLIAPEDLIIAKCLWSKSGESSRQIEDAKGVYQLQKDTLNIAYLQDWASKLSVEDSLRQIMAQS